VNADNCCTGACQQGRDCPLVEARKRGFVAPVIQKKPEPPKPESKAVNYWLVVLIAIVLAAVIADGAGAPITVPFSGK
jgi:hypothetical protein